MTYVVYGNGTYKYGDVTRFYGIGSETVTRWGLDIDWDGDGLYTGNNDGIYMVGMKLRRGRQTYMNINTDGLATGFEPVRVGTATITLDNSTRRYDPYNTSSPLYPYVLPGRYIRLRNLYNGTTNFMFHGKIKNITSIDNDITQQVRLEIEDGLAFLQSADSSVAIQQNIDVDDSIQLILTNVGWPSIFGTSLDDSSDVLSYWWAEDKALTEIRRLSDAELGNFYAAASGAATFRSRHHTASAVLSISSSDLLKEIDVPQPLDTIRNQIKLHAHPRTLIASGTLWQLQDTPSITANGGTLTIWASYSYNNNADPAINVVSPVATTDYTMNTQTDGLGTNLTSSFTVTFTDFGKTGKIVITNNHATLAGYVTLLKVRGQAIDASYESLLIQENTTSQGTYGKALLDLDNEWYQDTTLTNNFAAYLISFLATPQKFLTVRLEARPDIQFTPDLFDLITTTITKLSISGVNYRVAGIEHEWLTTNGQATRTTWILEPLPDLSGYWQFTTTIGITSRLGI